MHGRKEILSKVKYLYDTYPFPIWRKEDMLYNIRYLQACFRRAGINPKGKNILDVGCGTGLISAVLATLGGRVKGIDISEKSIEIARKNAKSLGLTAEFEVADLFAYSPSVQYDLVVCIGVLHHTHDPYAGFAKIVSLTNPCGYVVLGLYSRYSIAYRMIDMLVRRKFYDIEEGLVYVREHKALFSLFHPGLNPSFFGNVSKKVAFLHPSLASASDEYLVDKFCHAQRSYHTFNEVKHWMRKNDVKYLGLFSDGSFTQTFLSMFFFFNLVGRRRA